MEHAHPQLAGGLDLDSYQCDLHDTYSVQWCTPAAAVEEAGGDDTRGRADRLGNEAMYT